MRVTDVQAKILFTLGYWYEEANRRIKVKGLEVVISKKSFIDALMSAGVAGKKERALYKNLEALEKGRLINYDNRKLKLSPKGENVYDRVKESIMQYVRVIGKLKTKDPKSYTKKLQTVFK